MPEDIQIQSRSTLDRAPDSTELVPCYNRSSATYKHRGDDGKVLECGPGQSVTVPKNVAETWQKVSGGLVTGSATDPRVNDANAQLTIERAKNAVAEKRLAELTARLAELEKKK